MSIGERIGETISLFEAGNIPGALLPLSTAVDATATREYPQKKTGEAYKSFIKDNLSLISTIALGYTIEDFSLAYCHAKLKSQVDGLSTMEEVIYHVIRCDLIHVAGLPADIQFVWEKRIQAGSPLVLPAGLVPALVAAVIVSPVNCSEHFPDCNLNVGRRDIALTAFRGRKNKLLESLVGSSDDRGAIVRLRGTGRMIFGHPSEEQKESQ